MGLETNPAHSRRFGVLRELEGILNAGIEIGTVMNVDIDGSLQELQIQACHLRLSP
ncbi:MAG: hypothetical protein WBZ51_11335 [Xanthobacteraceae bacterium]